LAIGASTRWLNSPAWKVRIRRSASPGRHSTVAIRYRPSFQPESACLPDRMHKGLGAAGALVLQVCAFCGRELG
jgi:hypothetical protein